MLILFWPEMVIASEPNYNATYAPLVTTGFTVTITANLAGKLEKAMNFTGKPGANVYPAGTNNGKNRWGYIYNTGRVYLSFQMASDTPANIILRVDAKSDMKSSFSVTKVPGHPSGSNWNGWRLVPYRGSANIFAVATFNQLATKKLNVSVNVTAQ